MSGLSLTWMGLSGSLIGSLLTGTWSQYPGPSGEGRSASMSFTRCIRLWITEWSPGNIDTPFIRGLYY